METVVSGAMSDVITALTTALSAETFFGVIKDVIPYLAIIVPVALGFTMLRRLINSAGKAKVRI